MLKNTLQVREGNLQERNTVIQEVCEKALRHNKKEIQIKITLFFF